MILKKFDYEKKSITKKKIDYVLDDNSPESGTGVEIFSVGSRPAEAAISKATINSAEKLKHLYLTRKLRLQITLDKYI